MPFDGNGTFTPATPQYPAIAGTVIAAADWNAILSDIATALSNCMTRDGQGGALANINMAGFDLLNAKATTPAATTFGKEVQTSNGVDLKIAARGAAGGTAFTPTVIGSTTAGISTYTTQSGRYWLIGKLCFFQLYVNWLTATGTGNLRIGGLPFAAAAGASPRNRVNLTMDSVPYSDTPIATVDAGDQFVKFWTQASNAALGGFPIDTAGIVSVTGFYETV